MTGIEENRTAMLAAAVGGMLFASSIAHVSAATDARATRELAVLARVLENRLANARTALAAAVSGDGSGNPRARGPRNIESKGGHRT